MRLLMTAFVFGIPETKMRCIAPHVGGGVRDEDLPLPRVRAHGGARREDRPARQVGRDAARELRRDDARPRSRHIPRGRARSATARSPRSRRRRTPTSAASSRRSRPASRPRSTAGCCPGAYRIPAIHCQVLGVYTNTGMVDAYRGAGRPEATYVVERAMDLVARELGLDPVEVRRKNFIPPDAFPYDPRASSRALVRHAATTRRRSTGRSRSSATTASAPSRRQARKQGRLPRHRLLDLRRDLRRRAVGLDRHRRRGLGRGHVGEREHPRPPDRQGRSDDRHAAARTGPRDDDRADRGRRARHRRSRT